MEALLWCWEFEGSEERGEKGMSFSSLLNGSRFRRRGNKGEGKDKGKRSIRRKLLIYLKRGHGKAHLFSIPPRVTDLLEEQREEERKGGKSGAGALKKEGGGRRKTSSAPLAGQRVEERRGEEGKLK